MRHPADHGNIAPTFREAGHRIAPIVVIQVDPRIVVLHVIVVHVVVHRHVWQVGHVEIAEAFGEKRVERDNRICDNDFKPGLVEVCHVVFGDGAPLVADFLRLDAGGFHRVGVLPEVRFGHLVEVEDRFKLFRRVRRNAFRIVFGDARDLLQLDATAFDGVAADDGARVGEEHDAAMNEDGWQQKCHKIGFPTFAIVDKCQDQGEENDVPRVFRADEHHAA